MRPAHSRIEKDGRSAIVERYVICPAGQFGVNFGIILVRQKTEEGCRTYQRKRCEYNNKDEDNSPKTLSEKIFSQYSS